MIVITWITPHLPTPEGWKAELDCLSNGYSIGNEITPLNHSFAFVFVPIDSLTEGTSMSRDNDVICSATLNQTKRSILQNRTAKHRTVSQLLSCEHWCHYSEVAHANTRARTLNRRDGMDRRDIAATEASGWATGHQQNLRVLMHED